MAKPSDMGETNLYQLLERLGNLLRTEVRKAGAKAGLQPVHLQALHYLSQCNRYSDTPAAVTDYLGATKGTVSQTLSILEKKGYIEKRTDVNDRRVQHLELTESAHALLQMSLPPKFFTKAESKLMETDAGGAVQFLTQLLRELQYANQSKTFGVCKTCHFFQSHNLGYQCGLTSELLQENDIVKICREHQPGEERE